jgi:hypothetical protein
MRFSEVRRHWYREFDHVDNLARWGRRDGLHDAPDDPVIFYYGHYSVLFAECLRVEEGTMRPRPIVVLYCWVSAVPEQCDLTCHVTMLWYIRGVLRGENQLMVRVDGPEPAVVITMMPDEGVNHQFIYRYLGLTWFPLTFHIERILPTGEEEVGTVSVKADFVHSRLV